MPDTLFKSLLILIHVINKDLEERYRHHKVDQLASQTRIHKKILADGFNECLVGIYDVLVTLAGSGPNYSLSYIG